MIWGLNIFVILSYSLGDCVFYNCTLEIKLYYLDIQESSSLVSDIASLT